MRLHKRVHARNDTCSASDVRVQRKPTEQIGEDQRGKRDKQTNRGQRGAVLAGAEHHDGERRHDRNARLQLAFVFHVCCQQ